MPSVWLSRFESPKYHQDELIGESSSSMLAFGSYEIANSCCRPALLVALVGCSILATIIDFLPQACNRWAHKCTAARSARCQETTMVKKKDLEALIGDEEDRWRKKCRVSITYGVCLMFTRVNALPIWLCVHALEPTRVRSAVHVVAYSMLHKLGIALRVELTMWLLLPPVLLPTLLSTSLFALLLVAKRAVGHQRTVILVVYSLSATLGVRFWTSIGMTEAETFAVFMPLTMSCGTTAGLWLSHAF